MTATQVRVPPSCPRRVRPNIIPSRSVCRQLFGPVNHEQMRADLLREKRKMSEENAQKWNFDFENGVPLVGSYVWERICSNLRTEKPDSSLPDSVNGTGANQRLGCFSLPSTELTTATTTTSSDATKCPVSNDSCPDHAENDLIETKKRFRHIRKTRSTGKITGKSKYCFCLRHYIYIFIVALFLKRSFALFAGTMQISCCSIHEIAHVATARNICLQFTLRFIFGQYFAL